MSVLISSAPCGKLFTKFLEVQLSPQVSIELPTVVVLDPAGAHSLLTDHLLDEPVVLPHVVKESRRRRDYIQTHTDFVAGGWEVPLCRVHALL